MTLIEYFHLIQEKIINKDFIILEINEKPTGEKSVYLESINYMMWEWCDDNNDKRTHIFDYIIKPNNVDYDFTSVKFEDFIKFLSQEKSKEVVMVNLE